MSAHKTKSLVWLVLALTLGAASTGMAQERRPNDPGAFGDRQRGTFGDPGQGYFGDPASGYFGAHWDQIDSEGRPIPRDNDGRAPADESYLILERPSDARDGG